mmetsp:Transcript_69106/g.156681  ORF Transcript_69106/g.156681 Transcript_69106/m.156681 type:complete len:276 (+) Transcript_69106:394-1221(+)
MWTIRSCFLPLWHSTLRCLSVGCRICSPWFLSVPSQFGTNRVGAVCCRLRTPWCICVSPGLLPCWLRCVIDRLCPCRCFPLASGVRSRGFICVCARLLSRGLVHVSAVLSSLSIIVFIVRPGQTRFFIVRGRIRPCRFSTVAAVLSPHGFFNGCAGRGPLGFVVVATVLFPTCSLTVALRNGPSGRLSVSGAVCTPGIITVTAELCACRLSAFLTGRFPRRCVTGTQELSPLRFDILPLRNGSAGLVVVGCVIHTARLVCVAQVFGSPGRRCVRA